MTILLLCGGGYFLFSNLSHEHNNSSGPATSNTPILPQDDHITPSTGHPIEQPHCALVVNISSPVWVNPDDVKPLKWKMKKDQVRLIDYPLMQTSHGSYQAVGVPKDSPTGYGWMLVSDLAPTTCATSP